MSAIAGRQRRPRGTGIALPILGGKVLPEIHAKAHRQADALGITLALYLERLVEKDPDLERQEHTLTLDEAKAS